MGENGAKTPHTDYQEGLKQRKKRNIAHFMAAQTVIADSVALGHVTRAK